MTYSFNQLPEAVSKLHQKLENIERLLLQKSETQHESEHWLDLEEFCSYLPEKPSKPTVYGWVSKHNVPHHKRSKKLYFLKSEIDVWLRTGRKKTAAEIEAEAGTFLQAKRKRG